MSASSYILPCIVLFIVGYAIKRKVSVYDAFIEGAKESFDMIVSMFPSLLAMIFGVNIFIKSGILNGLFAYLNPLLHRFHIPSDILPMAFIRPISGSSSLAILNTIFEKFTPDSYIGRLASVVQGSTDTTFYVLTLYFGSVGIKKIKHSLWAGLAADVAGFIAAIIFVQIFF